MSLHYFKVSEHMRTVQKFCIQCLVVHILLELLKYFKRYIYIYGERWFVVPFVLVLHTNKTEEKLANLIDIQECLAENSEP